MWKDILRFIDVNFMIKVFYNGYFWYFFCEMGKVKVIYVCNVYSQLFLVRMFVFRIGGYCEFNFLLFLMIYNKYNKYQLGFKLGFVFFF